MILTFMKIETLYDNSRLNSFLMYQTKVKFDNGIFGIKLNFRCTLLILGVGFIIFFRVGSFVFHHGLIDTGHL